MGKQAKLDLLVEACKPHERAAVRAAVEKFFRGRSMDDPAVAINVVLREAWRFEHGDTAQWDRMALAGGVVIR